MTSLAANFRRVAADWWQRASFSRFSARRTRRKCAAVQGIKGCGAASSRELNRIPASIEALTKRSRALRGAMAAQFETKSEAA
jgi:hypothetical protein